MEDRTDQIVETPGLVNRMAALMDLDVELGEEELVERLIEAKWRFSQTYSQGWAGSVEERQPVW